VTATPPPPHPIRRVQRGYYIAAGVLVAVGAVVGLAGARVGGGGLAGVALLLGLLGYRMGCDAGAVQIVNLALERLTRGQVDETEALLARIPAAQLKGGVARAVALQRAKIALGRGDPAEAVAQATRAVEPRPVLLGADFQRLQVTAALGIRALAYASLGRSEEAIRDAERAEAADNTSPPTLGYASLARAVLLARTGDTEALARHLQSGGASLLEWLPSSRERALLRALRAMARARRGSVYREPARPDEASEEARVAAWIAKLAPGAAAFVQKQPHAASAAALPPPRVDPAGARAVEDARRTAQLPARSGSRTAVLWVLLVVMLVVMFSVVGSSSAPAHGAHAASGPPLALIANVIAIFLLLYVALVAGIGALQLWRTRSRTVSLARASVEAARGHEAEAQAKLERIAAGSVVSSAGAALLAIAGLAERRADWPAVVAGCDRGIARSTQNQGMRAVSSDLLLPELVALRGLALAALGRQPEADAELATLARDFPTFGLAPRAAFRVALVSAVRAGDVARAADVARGRTLDLALTIRDDTLADLVLAAVDGASDDERARIEAELGDDGALRAWIDAVAPGLRGRVASAPQRES
jgi:tetratricopeptide (TPR) repeat protein